MTVNAGQIVALVGPSGAGKTTFANLLMRFHDPSSGKVRIDGKDLRSITQADLRSQIAYVPQNPILFNDSVRNNILLGKTDSSVLTLKKLEEKPTPTSSSKTYRMAITHTLAREEVGFQVAKFSELQLLVH